MNKTQLLEQLARPSESTAGEWQEVDVAVKRYPYSSALQLLWLTGAKVWGEKSDMEHGNTVAGLYINDKHLLEKCLKAATKYEPMAEDFDVMKEINDYQEPSFKTAPRNEIISRFLDSSRFSVEDGGGDVADENIEQLAKNSVDSTNTLPTETLALIFEKQGKKDKAIEVYEKLMARYPEKSNTFANRIEQLKAL